MAAVVAWLQQVGGALRGGLVDFYGQDQVYTLLLLLAGIGGVGGFFGGLLLHSFAFTVYAILAAAAAACIFCVPSWPFYARHTVDWTPHDPARLEALYLQQQQQQQQLIRAGEGGDSGAAAAAEDAAARNSRKKKPGRKGRK